MKEQLEAILAEAKEALSSVKTARELGDVRVKYLGKKGALTAIRKGLKDVAPEDRPAMGQLINDVVAQLEQALTARGEEIERIALEEKLASETLGRHDARQAHRTGQEAPAECRSGRV